VLLVVFGIGGGVLGKALSGYRSNYTVGGVIIGLIVGFILDILLHGYIATILNIDENLEALRIAYPEPERRTSSGGNSSGNRSIVGNKLQKKCKRCHKEVDEDYTGCPHCGNNTFE
jgi:hypothetical protein